MWATDSPPGREVAAMEPVWTWPPSGATEGGIHLPVEVELVGGHLARVEAGERRGRAGGGVAARHDGDPLRVQAGADPLAPLVRAEPGRERGRVPQPGEPDRHVRGGAAHVLGGLPVQRDHDVDEGLAHPEYVGQGDRVRFPARAGPRSERTPPYRRRLGWGVEHPGRPTCWWMREHRRDAP
jgi:hypothetical protein